MNCRGGKSCRGGGGIDRGPAETRGERERGVAGGRWQVWGWAFLMVVTAVAGRQMASVLLGESHKQGHRESQEDQSQVSSSIK